METTMFALGILAMIMVMLITVVVVGIVKVFRMNKQIKELFTYIHEIERHWSDRLNDTHRDINMIEGTMRNSMDQYDRVVNDQITDSVTQSNSYTDKRIDKLIDTYFEVQEAKQQSKKLIKG
jgi:hypothetical protein